MKRFGAGGSIGMRTLVVAALAAMAVLPPLRAIGRRARAQSQARAESVDVVAARNNNAFARILGELRMGAADMMFVKTDAWLHGGVRYLPHTDEHESEGRAADPATLEGMSGGAVEREHDEHADEAESGHNEIVRTIVRDEREDFRGWLGDLEREVKPWREPELAHELSAGAELLPLYRMIALSNPSFIRAWRLGAMWLTFEDRETEALAFLDEGIQKNPGHAELFQLHLSRVTTLTRLAQTEGPARLEEALADATRGVEAALRSRPDGGKTGVIRNGLLWTEEHEEDFLFVVRFEPLILERLGRLPEAAAAARRARALAPEDGVLQRIAERLGG
jgi:hypothetical protein